MLNRTSATFLLVLATVFWGFAFIAQKNAMEYMGPLTFIGVRYLVGGLVIVPLAVWEYRRSSHKISRRSWAGIAFVSVNFLLGSWLQQAGLQMTTATNGGFLTGFYVFFVPLILLLVFRKKPHPIVWFCAPLALAGLYYLNGGSLDSLNRGDVLIMICSVFWALHVLMLGFLSRETGLPIFISAVSFLSAGALAGVGAFALETPTIEAVSNGWLEIAYAAIFSTSIAFTLQAVGQMHVPPANAAIILSGEALFAAIGGALILSERLTLGGYFGASLIFASIVMVETVPALRDQFKRKGAT